MDDEQQMAQKIIEEFGNQDRQIHALLVACRELMDLIIALHERDDDVLLQVGVIGNRVNAIIEENRTSPEDWRN
jgi:hypothetical protein